MIRNKKILIGVLVAVVGVAAVGGFSVMSSANTQAEGSEQVYLRTQTLAKETLEETVTGTGTVSARDSAAVYSDVNNGKISEILVSTSDYVTEGETMFVLDMTTLNENILAKEEDISERSQTLQDTFNSAKEDANEAYNVIHNAGGTKEVYDLALAEFEEVQNAVVHLQNNYDWAYNDNQEKSIAVQNAKNDIALLVSPVMPTAPIEPAMPIEPAVDAENYAELKAQYDLDLVNYNNTLLPEYTALKAQYDLDLDNYNNVLVPEYNAKLSELNNALSIAQAAQTDAANNLAYHTDLLEEAKISLNYDALEKAYTSAKQTYDTSVSSYENLLDKQITADDAMYNDTSLASMQDQLEEYYSQKEDYYIKAEISGQVTEINTEVGSIVGQSSALAKIQDTNSLEIDIDIPESDINKIKVGQEAVIRTDAFSEEVSGIVVEISPTATQEGMGSTSSNFTVKIDVQNEVSGLLVGMNAQADIIVASQQSEFVVPLSAIETVNGVSSIYIQTGDELIEENFTKINVELLENDGYYTQIQSSELTEGMKVVTTLNAETISAEDMEETTMMMPGMGGMTGEAPAGGQTAGGQTGGGPSGGRG